MSATVSVREYILLHGSCPVFDRTQQAEDMIEIHFLSQDSEDAEMESPKKNLELPLRIETDQKECGQIEEKAVEGFQSKEYERIFPHAAVCGPYGAEKTGSVIDAPLFGVCARIEIPVWDFYSGADVEPEVRLAGLSNTSAWR